MKRYKRTFEFADTIEEANAIVTAYNKTATPYQKRKHPANITPWESRKPQKTCLLFGSQFKEHKQNNHRKPRRERNEEQ